MGTRVVLGILALVAMLMVVILRVSGPEATLEGPLDHPGLAESLPLGGSFQFLLDQDQSVDAVLTAYEDGSFTPHLDQVVAQRSPTHQDIWAITRIQPPAQGADLGPEDWHLVSDSYGLLRLELFAGPRSQLQQVLRYDVSASFDPENFSGTVMRSAPFAVSLEDETLIVARVAFGPVNHLGLRLLSPDALQNAAYRAGIGLTAYYAFAVATLIIYTSFSFAMRSRVGLGYAAVITMGLMFIAYVDWLPFRFLYPNWPEGHLPIGMCLLSLVAIGGTFMASTVAGSGGRLARVLRLLAGAMTLVLPFIFLAPPEVMDKVTYALMVTMFGATSVVTFFGQGDPATELKTAKVFGLFLALSTLGLFFFYIAGFLGGALPVSMILRGIFVLVALWVMVGTTIAIVDLRQQHARAIEGELSALRKEAALGAELLDAEKAYSRVRVLAAQRQRQLAAASHDLRQPIKSLRMTLDSLAKADRPEVYDRFREAFDYIEDLSTGYLDSTTPDPVDRPEPKDTSELFPVSLLIESCHKMFLQEAVSKGIQLRAVPSSVKVQATTLVAMRILSNLVANAVKHTTDGKVLIGARRKGVEVEVHVIDQGPGLSAEALDQLKQAYVKGADSEGTGLGLSICFELAAAHDLPLTIREGRGRGTHFVLTLPKARGA